MGDNREISKIHFAVGEQYGSNIDKEGNSNIWTLFCSIFLSLKFILSISLLHFILLTLMLLFVIPGYTLSTSKSNQKDVHFLCAYHSSRSLLPSLSKIVVSFTDVEKNGKETVAT